ncbi:sodium-dependent transporter [Mediterraneibacter sp.]|uniref:sodium-dependent transporter n=1 Tax=Mediterraneibacter sp. TaxID=2316022 RepID=UPI0027B95724|nr:sodium-dependent transporter [Mediterraneibacter sp.]
MKRENFGSRLGFILVSAGCAIGLGNVWKFPYMVGQYGGAAFILIYLLFLIILGLPIIVCEFSVGRASQKSIATSYNVLEPKGTRWHFTRWFAIAGNYLLVMFYSMVGGWMLYYCFRMAKGEFTGINSTIVSTKYDAMLQSPVTLTFWTILVILLAFWICSIGLQKGVEKIMKITMLCLLAIMIVLAIRSVTLPGSAEGLKFYLVPDFGKLIENGIGNVVFGAMSQAFFTLSIGMGGMAIFGSYLDKSRSLTGESLSILMLDTCVALTAGLIVFPACFAFNVQPDAGPRLVFITLPNIFTQMPAGRLWGALFFLFLFFAALSTIVGVFENIVSFGIDLFGFSRKKSVGINILLITILSIPCILGFNILSGIQPLGSGSNIMDLEDFLVSNNILPLGSVIYLMFCTHKNGWGWDNFIQEANAGNGLKFPQFIRKYMTYVLPWIVVIIYLKGYYDKFHSQGNVVFGVWMAVAFAFLLLVFSVTRKKKQRSLR